ncbi:MAG: hypothetical protein M4579_000663 [Chaenotheca gracillima]|nr:MAG: hypothetical protein M4579_000663 [Chaenotheca gracillima]
MCSFQFCGDLESPLIIDGSYSSPESSALHYGEDGEGGLVLGEEFRAALLSMPENEKPAFTYPDYNATARLQAQIAAYESPQCAPRQSFPGLGDPRSHHAEAPYGVGGASHPASLAYAQSENSPSETHSPQLLSVDSCWPSEGSQGTKMHVLVRAPYDIATLGGHSIFLMFGNERCSGTVRPTGFQDQSYHYRLTADVPSFARTGWSDSKGLIILRVADETGNIIHGLDLGKFTYINARQASVTTPTSQGPSRKRKSSVERGNSDVAVKRASIRHLPADSGDDVPAFSYTPVTGSPYSPYAQPAPSTDLYALPSVWDRPQPSYSFHQRVPQRSISFPYPTISSVGQQSFRVNSPQTPSWPGPVGPVISQASRNLGYVSETVPSLQTGHAFGSPSRGANPPLIRTSTIQHPPTNTPMPNLSQPGQAFNPYAMYPNKANLKLQGELDDMADNWTPDERDCKRRLVQFSRRQDGSTIHATFEPIPQTERPPTEICISCILWEEKDECYVTSVDTIYLLEALVAVRFTVEEKNRIRRNLEGFRPLTVSKAKADSEEFFKVIMGFGNPKPRNIEKDVKVFPWKVLAHALKKIISKYSASYSSTAGALATPLNVPGSNCGTTSGVTDFVAATSTSYTPHLPSPSSISEPPIPPSSSALGIASAGFPQHVQHGPETPRHGSRGQPELHVMTPEWLPVQRRAQSVHDSYPRPHHDPDSWGLPTYLDANTSTSTPTATSAGPVLMDSHTLAYQHGMAHPPGHNAQMLTPVSGLSQNSHTMARQ